ncbi:type II secretion system inner membrane protein GspF [Thioalkalivibrio sp. ALE19]|uniref:type II secretion system inner membrane protein GspF n=1 Tax=Thioalkalivibrio sp. ALE19 TaxID=1266909 RepID=UPI00040B09D3|nr:type II secretion system inner membrane protein GspF [Thioalkalivibrio sp. ALE19]
MPAYHYEAMDGHGRVRKGVIEGENDRGARGALREQGLKPLEVAAIEEKPGRSGRTRAVGRISRMDLASATRQMATLAEAGIPIAEWLDTVATQSENPAVSQVLRAVRTRVVEGQPLSAALAEFPRVFPSIYRSTVAAGEDAGQLDGVLSRLADHLEAQHEMRQKIGVALIYPIILTLVAIAVTVGLVVYVVPEVVAVFDDTANTLPWITVALITLSDGARGYGVWVLAGLAAAGVVFARSWRRPGFRARFDGWLLSVPVVGRTVQAVNTARFTRTLGILTESGVPLLDALKTGAEVIENRPMRDSVEKASGRIREGAGIAASLQETGAFPPIVIHLIRSGEGSGQLNRMLERAARTQEGEVQRRISTAMGLFEPLLIVTMGLVVMGIVMAILLPIFDMNQLVG